MYNLLKVGGVRMAENAIYINDSIHGLIRLSEYEKRIISSIGFNRLHDVYQNSTVYLTYPTNRTKRFEHSIGTMKLCTDMFYNSILNASDETLVSFFEKAKTEIEGLVDYLRDNEPFRFDQFISDFPRSSSSIWKMISFDGVISYLIPRNIKQSNIMAYAILMQSIRVAALLHDIGHPPYSHVVEEAMMETYSDIKNGQDDEKKHTDFFKTIDRCVSGSPNAHLHEEMGVTISASILYNVISKDKDKEKKNLFEIIIRECVNWIFTEKTTFFGSIHRIIDSDLDGDRLDYVTRDPINSGISCGSMDYSRLLLDMKLIMCDGDPLFCIPVKAINTAEDFFQRRFNIYKNIVFHHRVKKTDYLLKDIVSRLLNNTIKNEVSENSKKSEDSSKSEISEEEEAKEELLSISGLWCPLSGGTSEQIKNDLSQWNDSWLMTFLKLEYYGKYHRKKFDLEAQRNEYILQTEMSELLCNEKNFYSIIKRSEDHNILDSEMYNTILNKLGQERIESYIKELDAISDAKNGSTQETSDVVNITTKILNKNINSTKDDDGAQRAMMVIDGMKQYLKQIIDKNSEHSQLWLTFEKGEALDVIADENWEDIVRRCVNDACAEQYKSSYIENILVFNKFKIGVTGNVRFYDKKNNTHRIHEVSNISEIIQSEYRYLPKIHLYVLTTKDHDATIEKDELLKNIGNKLGLEVVNIINKGCSELIEYNAISKEKDEVSEKSGTKKTTTKAKTGSRSKGSTTSKSRNRLHTTQKTSTRKTTRSTGKSSSSAKNKAKTKRRPR